MTNYVVDNLSNQVIDNSDNIVITSFEYRYEVILFEMQLNRENNLISYITSEMNIENFIASHRNETLFLERKKEVEVKL
ncbi:MAG: hypothetical protein GPJ50_03265 [Candidatus Heimdallarchaeota archaeon]|nr:hypothetical protein [Candidatus Heimdallarchaeota archaeon]